MLTQDKQIKIYFTPHPASLGFSPASRQTINDVINFSSEIGFKPVLLGRRAKIPINPLIYYLKMIKYWAIADIILATYPYICRPTHDNPFRLLESKLIEKRNKNKFSILYVIDLPIEQFLSGGKNVDKKAYKIEERILKSFDVLLVFNGNMKKQIQANYGIDDKKFVEFEILDYGVDYKPMNEKSISKPVRIVYSGDLGQPQSKWIQRLPYSENILYELSGPNGEWIDKLGKKNTLYKGVIPNNQFFEFLSQCHFGIIYRDFKRINYYEFTSTSKLSAYMVAGLPILVPSSYLYLTSLVKKYGVGYSFDSFDEIPTIVNSLTESDYNKIRDNCTNLGEKIKNGYFFETAVKKALEA